jgi:hypothetical protein
MKKPFYIFLTLISLFTLFFLNSCSNEDFANEGKNNLININQAREYFNNTPIKLKNNIYFSDELDWEKGHFENDTLAIPTLSMKPILIKKLKNEKTSKFLYPFLLITKNKTKNTYDYNLKVFISSSITAFNKNSYHLYDMNNKLILNKEKLAIYEPSKKTKRSRVECEEWGYFLINLETGQETLLYSWWECSGTNNEEEQAAPDGGDGGGGEAAIEQIIEEKIDDTKLDPCPKAVLDKLKILTQKDITGILKKFGNPANTIYDLRIIAGTTSSTSANADTKNDGGVNKYLITISDTYLKGTFNDNRPPTDLAIAAVMVHELIHAHFRALFDDYKNNGDKHAYDNYDCLFMQYVSENFEGTDDGQHAQMFENYLDVMANTLQEFQTGVPVPEGGKAESFYHDLALSTLQETKTFIKIYPNEYNAPNYAETRRILNNRRAEDQNKIIPDGQNGNFIPKGKACN